MGESDAAIPPLDIRASDEERKAVADALRQQTTAGRLTLGEFEERLGEVYASKTRAELQRALRELPVASPAALAARAPSATASAVPSTIADREVRAHYRRRRRRELSEFAVPNAVCNAIWALSGGHYWWPGWVALATGVGLLRSTIRGFDLEEERERMLTKRRDEAMDRIEKQHRSRPAGP